MQLGWGPAAGAFVWLRRTAIEVQPGSWLFKSPDVHTAAWSASGGAGGAEAHDLAATETTPCLVARGYSGYPAWYTWAEYFLTPAAWAVLSYRVAHRLWIGGLPSLALVVSLPARIGSGADIHPQAVIGRRFRLSHGFGVAIGATAEIGDDCILLQGVTLGVRHVGQPEPPGVRVHPRLGNLVRVGAGAVLLGSINVGDRAQIGANAVVLRDVPAGATAVGVPARILDRRRGTLGVGADGAADPAPASLAPASLAPAGAPEARQGRDRVPPSDSPVPARRGNGVTVMGTSTRAAPRRHVARRPQGSRRSAPGDG